jgi:hypothetical protein
VLDVQLGPFFYEHQMKNPRTQKFDTYESCPKEWEVCPICESDKESYYVMMLSVVDMRPFTKSDGTQIRFSRKLLPVKAAQHGFFMRQFDRAQTLRGMHLLMTRDSQQALSIGNPEFVEMVDEAALLAEFGGPEQKDQQGNVIKAMNADCFPFNYGQLFHKPSAEDLRVRYGGTAPAGSAQHYNQQFPATAGGAPAARAPGSAITRAAAPAAGQPAAQPGSRIATRAAAPAPGQLPPGGTGDSADDIPL